MIHLHKLGITFFLNLRTGTPIHEKKQLVEKYLEGKRLKEEKALLEREMLGFLKYYKDAVVPAIDARLTYLAAVLQGKVDAIM